MKRRTQPALYLHPSGNYQGGGYFIKIDNREHVHRKRIAVIPMPDKTVGDVHQLANQHKYLKEGIQFRDRKGKADDVAVDTDITNDSTGVSDDESFANSDSDYESSADSDNDPKYPDSDDK